MSLIGFYVSCQIAVSLYIPQLKTYVSQQVEASCLVIDDRLDRVGNLKYSAQPIMVDCSKDKQLIMLKETTRDPRLLFLGEQCE